MTPENDKFTSYSFNMGSISTQGKAFPPGIHVPSLTWFQNDANQEIDWDQQSRHIEFLIKSGLDGGMYINKAFLI